MSPSSSSSSSSSSPRSAAIAVKAFWIASEFFETGAPVSKKFSLSSTWARRASPNFFVGTSEKQSIRQAMEHLLARNREIRPLCLGPARPMKVEW
jgi:hypothetical protein